MEDEREREEYEGGFEKMRRELVRRRVRVGNAGGRGSGIGMEL